MKKLAEHLQTLGVIAVIPTDTVYGVVARAADPDSVSRLYELKHREGKPGTLVASSIDQLVALGIEQDYLKVAEKFWPGALSVIIPCGPRLAYLHEGVESLAVRIPCDPWLLELLKQTGPLLTSSANLPGNPPATTINQAKDYFGDKVTWYEDGGQVMREPSTIIKIVNDSVEIVRQGAVQINL